MKRSECRNGPVRISLTLHSRYLRLDDTGAARILYFEDLSVGMTEQEWVHNAAQNGRSLSNP